MNGYDLTADSYRVLKENGEMDGEKADRLIRLYEFLSGCEDNDILELVNSGAFNDVIRGYAELAARKAGIDGETRYLIKQQMRWLFSEKTAGEVMEEAEAGAEDKEY